MFTPKMEIKTYNLSQLKQLKPRANPAPSDLPTWQTHLANRGILAPALLAEWHGGNDEWLYPIKDLDGTTIAHRVKSYAPQPRMKYRWHPAKPKECNYYYAQNLRQAIADNDGKLYIAAGEVDLLTFVAVGINNVLSWFGETNIPRNLTEHLQTLGVREVIYLPDKDDAGYKSAVKVRDRLQGTGIHYSPRQLPDDLPAKADTNDLWCALKFNAQAFRQIIEEAPIITLPAPKVFSMLDAFMPNYEPSASTLNLAQISHEIERRLDIRRYNGEGWSQAIPCIFKQHHHDDERPATSWNRQTHVLHCHKCGETWLAKDVAEKLGIHWKPTTSRKRKTPKKGEVKSKKDYNLQDLIKPFTPDPLQADVDVNVPYVSDLEANVIPNTSLLIRSAIGTGKTEFVKRLISHEAQKKGYEPTVLVITHRQALAENIAQRLNMQCYKDLDNKTFRQAKQLVIVYNSLWRLSDAHEMIPTYDLIIIDEIEQFHDHLGGATFNAGEAKRAYDILRELVKHAGRIVGLDAHASDISRAWLTSFCPNLTTINNAHIPDRGTLTLHAYRETVIKQASQIADANQGVVVLPTNSKGEAKRLESYFSKRYGKNAVFMISSENSETPPVQNFIREINTRISQLRIFIYSPSLGTGIDITAPVRAVCAVLKGNHMAAHDLHQLIGRCRNMRETHAYVQISEGHREENWQAIYQQHERNALRTGQICAFDDVGIYSVTPIQQSMLKLLAMLEARRNRSLNTLLSAFVALAQGYHLCYHSQKDEGVKEALKQVSKTIAEAEREHVLKAHPIDTETLKRHRQEGTLTTEISAGHQRWLIEETVGRKINDTLYTDLHEARDREKLRLFTDLETNQTELQARDQQEAREEYLLMRRKHHTMRQYLLKSLIKALWDCASIHDASTPLTGEDINVRMQDFMTQHHKDIMTYFGWRNDQSKKAIAIARWVMAQIGIRLESTQIMQDGKRYRTYTLHPDDVARQQDYAQSRRAHLDRKNRAQNRACITQNVVIDITNAGFE